MLVETTQSHDAFEDAQDALEGLKNLPGFLLGYIVPGKPKTRLVFLFNCTDGDVSRTQKFVEDLTTKMERGCFDYFRRIDALGGMVEAIEAGFPQKEIMDAAYA